MTTIISHLAVISKRIRESEILVSLAKVVFGTTINTREQRFTKFALAIVHHTCFVLLRAVAAAWQADREDEVQVAITI
jgi:hypothetical protein